MVSAAGATIQVRAVSAASSFSSSRMQVRQVRAVICWKMGMPMNFWMRVFVARAATREK